MGLVTASDIAGLKLVASHLAPDERGSMSRLWPSAAAPDDFRIEQVLVSRNNVAHTLRGMHFQRGPSTERKIVAALRGRLVDVALDLRADSDTYLDWTAIELSADQPIALLLPRGIAHGYLTLVDNTEVSYLIDQPYEPHLAAGVRWDDPLIGIDWPSAPRVISDRDTSWPFIERGFSAVIS